MASFPIDLKFGTAGILRPDALAQYRDEMHSYLFEDARESDSAQDVMDSFGMRHWLRRWATSGLRGSAHTQARARRHGAQVTKGPAVHKPNGFS